MITATVKDAVGSSVSGTTALNVSGPSVPLSVELGFATPTQGRAPLVVEATATPSGGHPGTGSNYSYVWSFGDGTTQLGSGLTSTVTHTYNSPGNYSLTVTVHDLRNDTASAAGAISVAPVSSQLSGTIEFDSPSVGYLPMSITVTANASGGTAPYDFQWDFGNGAVASGQVASHTYTAMPTSCTATRCIQNVTLTVRDAKGAAITQKAPVVLLSSVATSLTITASASNSTGPSPLTTELTASAQGGTAPYTYVWDFGDGGSAVGAVQTHVYTNVGTYSTIVTVVDSSGVISQALIPIIVYPTPPLNESGAIQLTVSATPVTGPAPLSVSLQALASGGTGAYHFTWLFGDGSPAATGASTTHVFSQVGTYAVNLLATDALGQNATTGVFISAYNPGSNQGSASLPAVTVTVLRMSGAAPFPVTFYPSVHGGIAPYELTWNFGDGSPLVNVSNATEVAHVYRTPGTYYPSLEVKDVSGNSAQWLTGMGGPERPILVQGAASHGASTAPPWVLIAGAVTAAVVVGVLIARTHRKRPVKGPRRGDKGKGPEGLYTSQHPAAVPPAPPLLDDPLRDVFAPAL